MNLPFPLLTIIHRQQTCHSYDRSSSHVIRCVPSRRSGPPPHRSSLPFNSHRARVRRNHGRLRSNGFIEDAPSIAHAAATLNARLR